MNGHPRFGYQEGVTKEAQRLGSRAKLLKQAEDGVPFDERKFGMGQGLRPQLVNFVRSERILIQGCQDAQLSFLGYPSTALQEHHRRWCDHPE